MVGVCLPELLENIRTVCFRFMVCGYRSRVTDIFTACSIRNVEVALQVRITLPPLKNQVPVAVHFIATIFSLTTHHNGGKAFCPVLEIPCPAGKS